MGRSAGRAGGMRFAARLDVPCRCGIIPLHCVRNGSHRQEREMTVTTMLPELVLRSPEADWDRARWETLPDDGNRYEVIDGVLYMTTAPSSFHQWIIRQIVRVLFQQIDDASIGITTWAPIGLFMPGCDPVQPDILVVRNT